MTGPKDNVRRSGVVAVAAWVVTGVLLGLLLIVVWFLAALARQS